MTPTPEQIIKSGGRTMNAYIANYYDHWPFGGYEEIACVVVANTSQEALGLVLEKYPDKTTDCWTIEEIDITKTGCQELSNRSS